jgi:hypothetical protein
LIYVQLNYLRVGADMKNSKKNIFIGLTNIEKRNFLDFAGFETVNLKIGNILFFYITFF